MGANTVAKSSHFFWSAPEAYLFWIRLIDLLDGKQLIDEAHRELGERCQSFSLDFVQAR